MLGDKSVLLYEKPRSIITTLDMSGNPIGEQGVILMVNGLGSALKELNVRQTNPFYHTSEQFSRQID